MSLQSWLSSLKPSRQRSSRKATRRHRQASAKRRAFFESLEDRRLLTFIPAIDSPFEIPGGRPHTVAVGDVNNDGNADLAIADQFLGVSVMLGDGTGDFGTPWNPLNHSAGRNTHGVAIGDLNGDGNADLAISNLDNNLQVLLGAGDGTFSAPATVSNVGGRYRDVVIGDVSGDGILDLVAVSQGPGYGRDPGVSVVLGVGDGTFHPVTNYPVGLSYTNYMQDWGLQQRWHAGPRHRRPLRGSVAGNRWRLLCCRNPRR